MMSLAAAAAYFDRTPVLDPDNGNTLFYGQLEPYDDSRRDAGAAYRRILSVAPGTSVPRVVRVHGEAWIVGRRESDSLGEILRDKYVLQPAGVKASISRLEDFLAGDASAAAWVAIEWLKDAKELSVSSDAVVMYTVIAPEGADLREHDIVWYAGRALMLQAPRHHPSGYIEAEAFELDQVLPATATVAARTFDPQAGAYTTSTTDTQPCLRVRWQSLYLYESQASARYQEGDTVLIVPPDAQVVNDSLVTLDGKNWKVLAVQTLSGVLCVHARGA